ncbi:MAG: glycosyl hydrolase family 28 protein [Planctomycetota bacterium]|nr:glycosyl hydrolase family 28 protein [Planctomycetota bacterium]
MKRTEHRICCGLTVAIACLGLCAGRPALAAAAFVNVLDHGAVADAKTLNTAALQKAIAACAEQNGGTVLVPAGVYRTGPLELKSNVTLQLEAGAVLRASEVIADHGVGGESRALIWARNAANIGICGRGAIDGRGTAFVLLDQPRTAAGDFNPRFTRQGEEFMSPKFGTADGPVTFRQRLPRLIRFDSCRNVLLSGVVFMDASIWTIHLDDCEHADITGLKVLNNPVIPNNDGIHLTTCRNVHISDCELTCGDDAICVTSVESRKPGFCENITVSNCTMSSRSAGIRVGYGPNTIRNCVFQNLVIRNSNRGIGLFVRQEGSIENVLFNNIIIQTRLHTGHWWGKGEPIHLSVLPERESNAKTLGRIRNVAFTNILAESEAGVVIWAQESGQIEDVTLDRIRLRLRKGPLSDSYGGNIDLRPAFDHRWAIFKHDLAGIFCHRATGLTLSQIDVRWDDDIPQYYTHALWCEETGSLVIDGFRSRQPGSADANAAILLDSVRGVIVRNSQAAEGTTVFLRHRGVKEAGLFGNNDVTRAATAIDPLPSPFASSQEIRLVRPQ